MIEPVQKYFKEGEKWKTAQLDESWFTNDYYFILDGNLDLTLSRYRSNDFPPIFTEWNETQTINLAILIVSALLGGSIFLTLFILFFLEKKCNKEITKIES